MPFVSGPAYTLDHTTLASTPAASTTIAWASTSTLTSTPFVDTTTFVTQTITYSGLTSVIYSSQVFGVASSTQTTCLVQPTEYLACQSDNGESPSLPGHTSPNVDPLASRRSLYRRSGSWSLLLRPLGAPAILLRCAYCARLLRTVS